jgi:hypothetical protein
LEKNRLEYNKYMFERINEKIQGQLDWHCRPRYDVSVGAVGATYTERQLKELGRGSVQAGIDRVKGFIQDEKPLGGQRRTLQHELEDPLEASR